MREVSRSVAFYERLGFTVRSTVVPPDASGPIWAWLTSGEAQLMVALANGPVAADQQAVLLYLYCPDVDALRTELQGKGLAPGPVTRPFYAPRGEFRLEDPDGYVLMVSHT
ncbi:MAG: VOC family protein [Vicinamibacterales bacterium]